MKKVMIVFLFVFGLCLAACEETVEENIECNGLDEVVSFIGEDIDLMDMVLCESSTRGDITDLVTYTASPLSEVLDINIQQVVLYDYTVEYENGDVYTKTRRIVVKNEAMNDTNDLLNNMGGFNGLLNVSNAHHIDYPQDIFWNINPDLDLLQFVITEVPESDNWPQYYFDNEMTLEVGKTYQLTMEVRGTVETSFRVDIVNFSDQPNEMTIDVTTVVPLITVPVTTSDELTQVTYTFSPTIDTTEGIFRFIMGSSGSVQPSGEIHIDNVKIVEIT